MVKAEEVEQFVLENLYDILQLKSSWIKLNTYEFEPLRVRLLQKYFLTFGSEAAWKKRGSQGEKRAHVKQFNAAIKGWLNSNYPTHGGATFTETKEVIFDDKFWPMSAKKRLEIEGEDVHKNCESSCLDEDSCDLRYYWIECGDNCKMRRCRNRDAQGPFDWTTLMQLKFINKNVGGGVFALLGIKRGQFLGVLTGEALPEAQSKALYNDDKENDYAFEVDPRKNFALWTIDPKKWGNILRFVNHSCAANCEMQVWTVRNRRTVKLIALRDIDKDEELTFNYMWNKPSKICHCGATNCRGYL